ncbi:hypothetical protein [Duganella sp. OV458]|uniref:hypothetical protein n=2 Tax=unclassified Duganella TaxID=2636909 RepID=UPI0008853E5C|nr:hypothetical protein [Duganella sp. OV458]SDH27721.1 protein TonB, links inner and outer membranes [Duganella sp. OV458]SDK40034.1 protein TonB, links inner and outer membranes [Duganella sp. OV510]
MISFDTPGRLRRPGIAAGLAVSLALHAVLLFAYRLSGPPAAEHASRSMTVWLQAPKPPAPIATIAPPPPPRKREREPAPAPVRQRSAVATAPQRAAAAEPAQQQQQQQEPAQPAQTQAITLPREQDPLYADQQPKQFNVDDAKKLARKVAAEKDPARAGTLSAQLEAHPLYPEETSNALAKKMEGAKKTDCLKSASGAGLLAPLFWALDKHCKF